MLFADAGWIENLLREISLFLCQIVYKFMVYLYELFEVVGTADVITSDSINVVYTRIGLILGIYMMFRVILAFIQMLINPDNISDKEKGVGNLAKKAIIVVALMGITPYIFEKAFDIQNFIVGVDSKSNVIAKIVFPEKVVSSGSFGRSLSAYLFTSFYRYDDQYTGNDCPLLHKQGDTTLLYNTIVANGGSVGVARLCLNDDEDFTVYDEDGNSQGKYSSTFTVGGDDSLKYYKIDFTWNGIFAFLVGGFTCYVLLTYTLYVGARVIQLAFFRIIAPMAILSYLSPKKDTMFEKWIKMCGTTYVDLFIRMAIIYFVVFAVDLIMGSGNGIALTREYDHEWIVNIVMIVALLLFAKKAPELLKELFPSSGVGSLGFGFKSPKNLFNDMLGGNLLSKGYDKVSGFAKSIPKRAYGAAAVGASAWQQNVRKGIGKIIDNKDNKAERNKWIGRTLFGSAFGAVGGMRRGLMTTNKSGRKTAVTNAVDKTQADYKLHDQGYGSSLTGLLTKKGRQGAKSQVFDMARGFVGRDQVIEDMTAASDNAIQGLQYQINDMEKDYKGKYKLQNSKKSDGLFMITDKSGKQITNTNSSDPKLKGTMYFTEREAQSILGADYGDAKQISDKYENLGKLKAQNKALHQKENEQKAKSDK